MTANLVHFMPGARTHWHRHPLGQTVFVTEGVGLCQRRGGPLEVIRPGDRVLFEADEEHWHGAAPNRLMVHLAINEGDDEHDVVHWLDPSPTRSTPKGRRRPTPESHSPARQALRVRQRQGTVRATDKARWSDTGRSTEPPAPGVIGPAHQDVVDLLRGACPWGTWRPRRPAASS